MASTYKFVLRFKIEHMMQERESKYNELDTNFMEFAENRGSGPIKQFIQVYIRNLKFLYRNKSAAIGLLFSCVFSALLNISVYWNIGQFPDLL